MPSSQHWPGELRQLLFFFFFFFFISNVLIVLLGNQQNIKKQKILTEWGLGVAQGDLGYSLIQRNKTL